MFSEFFKMKSNPFGETPDPKFYFKSESHVQTLDQILASIRAGKGFTLITGEVGVGKTILSRILLNFLQKNLPTALVLNPVLNPLDLLTSIREEFKLPAPSERSLKSEYDALASFLMSTATIQKRCILLIDEAQRLSFDGLEVIRLLSNLETDDRKLLQIILIGQPELNSRLAAHELRQLNQRISVRLDLRPMTTDEIASYIRHRTELAGGLNFVRFEDDACLLIARLSGGIPRLVNSLCEKILSRAENEEVRLITPAIVASEASHIPSAGPQPKQRFWTKIWSRTRSAEQ